MAEGDSSSVQSKITQAAADLPKTQQAQVEGLVAQTAKLADVPSNETQQIFEVTTQMLNLHYTNGLTQARMAFRWALIAAIAGVVIFLGAIVFLVFKESTQIASIGAIGGAIVEAIAGLNFYLYGKTSEQLAGHRLSLDETQRILLANSIIPDMEQENRDKERAKLISALTEEDRDDPRSPGADKKGKGRKGDGVGRGGGNNGQPDS
jgi:uncharacterized membrane protein YgdD (TMEM256/DUF423 family)